jgi:hypothetical protein
MLGRNREMEPNVQLWTHPRFFEKFFAVNMELPV